MKKHWLYLSAALWLAACSVDEPIPAPRAETEAATGVEVEIPGTVIQTRAVTTPPDVLTQLREQQIPFNLKTAYPNHPYPYLSTTKSSVVDSWKEDQKNGKQQWYINEVNGIRGLSAVGGISDPENKIMMHPSSPSDNVMRLQTVSQYQWPFPPLVIMRPLLLLRSINGTDYYFIGCNTNWINLDGELLYGAYHVALNSTTRQGARKVTPSNSLLERWQIIPIEEYEIEEITFDYLAGDTFTVTELKIDEKEWYNDSPIIKHYSYNYTTEKTTESTFSNTQKISASVKVSTDAKFGIPGFANASLNTEVTTASEFTWNKGVKETIRVSETELMDFDIPPYSKVVERWTQYRYTADITYYARVKGVQTGTILYLPGRWKGTVVDRTKVETIYTPL